MKTENKIQGDSMDEASKLAALKMAIIEKKSIRFTYKSATDQVAGYRVGNPYVVYSKKPVQMSEYKDFLVNIYITEGVSKSGSIPDWRDFHMSSMDDIVVSDTETSFMIRSDYRPSSEKYKHALCKVKLFQGL